MFCLLLSFVEVGLPKTSSSLCFPTLCHTLSVLPFLIFNLLSFAYAVPCSWDSLSLIDLEGQMKNFKHSFPIYKLGILTTYLIKATLEFKGYI